MTQIQSEWVFTGRHMLIILFAFFAVVFAANFTLAYYANSTWTGLVVPNSYVASQTFDRDAAEMRRIRALGIEPVLRLEGGVVHVQFKNRHGHLVYPDSVTLVVGSPAHEGEVRKILLAPAGDGEYQAAAELAPGRWTGDIEAQLAGEKAWRRPVNLFVTRS